ncbi:hypothetical protein Tco_0347559 [Tanacetum coccineum]
MYHIKNVNYAFLLWEDFTFQVENKNTKKVNVMYYPRFTKLIVNFFMAKDPSIPQRNKIIWHYAKDDPMFTTLNVISRNENTQLYGAILPKELTNEDIRNSTSYKEYYTIALGEVPPKTKASVQKKKTDSNTTTEQKSLTDPKDKGVKQTGKTTGSGKQKQPTTGDGVDILSKVPDEQVHEKSGKDEGAGDKPEVPDVPKHHSDSKEESWTFSDDDNEDEDDEDEHDNDDDNDDQDNDDADDDNSDADNDNSDADDDNDDNDDKENSEGNDSDNDGDDLVHPKLSTFNKDDKEGDKYEEKANDDEDDNQDDDNILGGDRQDDDNKELYRDVNINLNRGDIEMTDAQVNQEMKEVHVTLTTQPPVMPQQSSSVSSDLVSKFINPSQDTGIDSILNPNVQYDIPVNVSVSTTSKIPHPKLCIPIQLAESLSNIPGMVDKYMTSKMKEEVNVAVQLKSNKLREEAQAENDEFLNQLDSNIQKIIKDQVKDQVKAQVKA